MKYSQLFSKTSRQTPRDETSINARLLIRAGFIDKVAAGIYSFLPLGVRVIDKIANIVREEMNAAGGQEVTLPVLHPKENWQKTGRWISFDALFKTKGKAGEFALGPTHEEIVVPLAKRFIFTYRDLPRYVYQIQTKFRDEPRSKSGLLRGREFLMKDLYSFHTTDGDLMDFYEVMKKAYQAVFARLGLSAIETKASGGTFSDFSHEYQVVCENGEDEIVYCPGGDYSENAEIATAKDGQECVLGHGKLKRVKTIEVGNIFPLKDRFSKAFNLTYKNKQGKDEYVVMGCYGIGISRVMGTIVEVFNDDAGIIWPKQVSPFGCHLVHIEDSPRANVDARRGEAGPRTESWVRDTYDKLTKAGVDVLWDDRVDVSAGEKFADSDLIGVPVRLVVSKKVGKGKVEWKNRDEKSSLILSLAQTVKKLSSQGQLSRLDN